ncbi:MAG: DUF3047 domain-containing protein [Calditrichaeota bacterium]|nr:MAG: DUF3047 domain-containing protein [Calditrichota bacterium]
MKNLKYKIIFLLAMLLGSFVLANETTKDSLIIEDFSKGVVGEYPSWLKWRNGWSMKKHEEDDGVFKPYIIAEENENKYLKADDTGQSIIIGKEVKWNLKKYPVLTWKWRVRKLPEDADAWKGKNDSAAGLYITFKRNFFGIPKSIKYIWGSTLPEGTEFRKEKLGKPHVIVVQSGKENVGEWVTVTRNLAEDFEKAWGEKPDNKILAIGFLTDGNSTGTEASADYDELIAYPSKHFSGSKVEVEKK